MALEDQGGCHLPEPRISAWVAISGHRRAAGKGSNLRATERGDADLRGQMRVVLQAG